MTLSTAEIYRQKESSSLTQTAKFIFSRLFANCEVFELGDLLNDIKTGKTPSKNEKKYYEDEFIDWFKPNEIGDKKYLEKAESKLSKFAYDKGQVTVYKANSILINAIGDVGRIAILNHEASSNQQITGIELNEEKLLTEYCYYYLLANRHHFYKDLFQTTLPIVNQKKIKLIPIPVPELNEQKRIVAFLNKLENVNSLEELKDIIGFDEFIEIAEKFFILKNKSGEISTELTHQLDLVKQLRQAFLREAMQGKLMVNGELSMVNEGETGADLLEKIKAEKERLIKEKKIKKQKSLPPITEEEIPFEIPENWVWCRLGELAINRDSEREPISQRERERREKIYDYYGASGVIDKIDGYTHQGKFVLIGEDGANLIAKSTPIAFVVEGKFWVNNHAHVLEFVDDIMNYFMSYCLNIIDINPFITGGFQPKLSQGNLLKIEIPLPPLSEQQRIVAKLDELMAYCDDLEASIKESQQQNELLLQQVLREALEPKEKEVEKV